MVLPFSSEGDPVTPDMKLRFYFSFRSPFAAISLYRLRRLVAFLSVDIEMLPLWPEVMFGGHLDNPSDNLFKMSYIFQDAARQAALAGISREPFDQLASLIQLPEGMNYKERKIGVSLGQENWERTHKAFLYALAQGKGWAFADAVCIRRFDFDGKGAADVMDLEIIRSLAESVGLEGEAMIAAIDDPSINTRMESIVLLGEEDGVFGVPFFVLVSDDAVEKFWGNDRLEHVLMQIQGTSALPSLPKVQLVKTVR